MRSSVVATKSQIVRGITREPFPFLSSCHSLASLSNNTANCVTNSTSMYGMYEKHQYSSFDDIDEDVNIIDIEEEVVEYHFQDATDVEHDFDEMASEFCDEASPFPTVNGMYLLPAFSLPFTFYRPYHSEVCSEAEEQVLKEKGLCKYRLATGSSMIPHPSKVHKGGEDAYFISENGLIFGVADGVGGWAECGVDPGLFSKKLMLEAKKVADTAQILNPMQIMSIAYDATKHVKGSSTALVLVLDKDELRSANLGDSGFMVIRKGIVVFRTKEQQHEFNYPFQIGTYSNDMPEHVD